MRVRAQAKFVRCKPRKVRRLTRELKGKPVDRALDELHLYPGKPARVVEKVLQSALSNAENNHNLDRNRLHVKEAYVDGGPILYRFQPRAFGRAYRIRKRISHVTVVVEEKE